MKGLYQENNNPVLSIDKTVIDLSNKNIPEIAKQSKVEKRKFCSHSKFITTDGIISNSEGIKHSVPQTDAEEFRIEACRILKHAKSPKGNATRKERTTLKTTGGRRHRHISGRHKKCNSATTDYLQQQNQDY